MVRQGDVLLLREADVRLHVLGGALDAILDVGERSLLVHEEHAPIAIEPGVYVVRRQREYVEGEERDALVSD
jgi:hypothetical protein